MQSIKEYLSTGTATEGSLLIVKKIYDSIIDEAAKAMIPRTEAALYFGPADIPGSSIDVDLLTPNSLSVRAIAEGAALMNDNTSYSTFNVKPVKYGVGIRITKELLEDGKWNLLQHNIQIAGRRFAENENSLVISELDNATNTVSGGSSLTVANITRAMQYLEDADYMPSTMAIGNEVLNDIRNLDTFAEFEKTGDAEMLNTGFRGIVYGMKVYRVSTNAGMTATTAYVFDRKNAYLIAEKRPITIENFDMPVYDLRAASITQRLKARYLRADAICKITTS